MKNLFDGVRDFSEKEFDSYRALFHDLAVKQDPHTLYIGCSDSRVVPDLITKSMPGDLFVVRNIANIVPHFRESGEYLATTSAIEYALIVLNVENIVVCGHSNCGGCKALFASESELEKIPFTRHWLELAAPVKERALEIMRRSHHAGDLEWIVEQENVVVQMNHLLTYPFIKERFSRGTLSIYGWYYEIGSGKVFNYNKEKRLFELIT